MESTWTAAIHKGRYEVFNIDLTEIANAIAQRDPSLVVQLFRRITPDRTATPLSQLPYTCATPCEGGTLTLYRQYSTPKLIKHDTFHVYGDHLFTNEGQTWEPQTHTEGQTTFEGNPLNWLGTFKRELINDLGEEVWDDIMDLVDTLRGSND